MAQMNTDYSSGPLDYSSAELRRNLNGYHLAHWYYFIAHGSHESHRFFLRTIYFFEHESHESNKICRRPTDQREVIFFLRTIGLFHPHGKSVSICEYLWENKKWSVCQKYSWDSSDSCSKKNPCSSAFYPCAQNIRYSSDSCSKKESVFICVYPCAKNVRFVFKENSCSKKAVRPSPTHQCRTQADHLYLIWHARRLPFPSPDTTITITPLHHFTTFLPFTIYIPWGKLLIPAPVAMRLPSRV